jgi:hypothetical protein
MQTALKPIWKHTNDWVRSFARRYWIGTCVILFATMVFFWPLVTHLTTYSEGGDAMFNAWTLARDHHCLLRQDCPTYADGNIYFPNKDSMLYSETQLSAGLVSLPLHFIDPNPILAYNVMTIISFFLAGWFMYLLAKRLSKGNELFSILAGLIFMLAPHRLSGLSHLQNLSIFCLPLAVLFILKFFETPKKRFLGGLFVTLLYLFFASWYQMVFGLIGICTLLAAARIVKMINWQTLWRVLAVTLIAAAMTLPLALQYTRFSKQNSAGFKIGEQVYYSSSVADYFLPNSGTLLGGFFYDHVKGVQLNAYNRDSVSYHGLILYATAATIVVTAFLHRKKDRRQYRLVVLFASIAVTGCIVSLGPLLKIGGGFSYAEAEGYRLVIPLPYIGVDLLLPQLSFIRAIGRASVLVLFALCALLAMAPFYMRANKLTGRHKQIIIGIICLLVAVELMPAHRMLLSNQSYNYNLHIPAVYEYIKQHPEVDHLIVLRSDADYPGAPIPTARTEDVLWAGYHNRNIFNGYSGYEPKNYLRDYADFVDFAPDDVKKLKAQHLRYVMVDKQLSTNDPQLSQKVAAALKQKIYGDKRYDLYKL